MRETLIANGVNNLKTYGYQNVTPGNILTDDIYSQLFGGMLEDWSGLSNQAVSDAALALMKEIER